MKSVSKTESEAFLNASNAILFVPSHEISNQQVEGLIKNFCGIIIRKFEDLPDISMKTVYLCGDISLVVNSLNSPFHTTTIHNINIIEEISTNYDDMNWKIVKLGQVPILIHGVGVYYRNLFNDQQSNYFQQINTEHTFQTLTESNKPSLALRTGIYITPVKKSIDGDLHFNLLRCSSNLSGPTCNFSPTDNFIVQTLNNQVMNVFDNPARLNHILAQIYHNTSSSDNSNNKQTKA